MSRRRQKWSIQVDEYPAKGERMYGPRTVVASHGCDVEIPNTEVDEIFIDGWCHIEGMSKNCYWMNIGGLDITVKVGKDGRAETVIYRVEPEPGVEVIDDSPARPL